MANWPAYTDDDASGTTGTIVTAAFLDSIRDYIGGAWTGVPHASVFFGTVGGGTWTVESGDFFGYQYRVHAKSCLLSFAFVGTTISGSPTVLSFSPPPGLTIQTGLVMAAGSGINNGTTISGGILIQTNFALYGNGISISLPSGDAFVNGTNSNNFLGQIEFQIT